MPNFNYYLDADIEIERHSLAALSKAISDTLAEDNSYRCDPLTSKWTLTQLKVLKFVLCNLVQHPNIGVLYERKHQATLSKRYNPNQIGIKVLNAVIDKLDEAGFIRHTPGDNTWKHTKENSPALLSEMASTEQLLELADQLGVTNEAIYKKDSSHIKLRSPLSDGGKFIDFKDTEYTRHIDKIMAEYCSFLNQQTLINELTGEQYSGALLNRSYRDRDGRQSLIYGGRSGGHWMSGDREITINGEATVEFDYNASILNNLHKHLYGSYLNADSEVDLYAIEDVHRDVTKALITRCMLNAKSRTQSTMRFNSLLEKNADLRQKREQSSLSTKAIVDAIQNKFSNLQHLFYQGPDQAEHYSWIDQNHLFEIAHQACLYDIPALTVHDSFIVRESDKDRMEMLMYSTCMPDVYSKMSLIRRME